ncbi:MAG: hypothetical protein H7Y39_11480, partial [Nitrospiraceae bacterium]|nr:hypothetical protein [Nitrospiraceae bacterium]
EHTCSSMTTREGIDPINTKVALDAMARAFMGGALASNPEASPMFAACHCPDPDGRGRTDAERRRAARRLPRDQLDLPGKCGEHQLRNQEVFYGKREQTDAGVSA